MHAGADNHGGPHNKHDSCDRRSHMPSHNCNDAACVSCCCDMVPFSVVCEGAKLLFPQSYIARRVNLNGPVGHIYPQMLRRIFLKATVVMVLVL